MNVTRTLPGNAPPSPVLLRRMYLTADGISSALYIATNTPTIPSSSGRALDCAVSIIGRRKLSPIPPNTAAERLRKMIPAVKPGG